MDLVTPALGLVFWTTLVFLIVLFLLNRFAWKPILGAVKERERSIEDALQAANKAKAEMERISADNERILKEARIERDAILKEAREIKDAMIKEAGDKAREEGQKMLAAAQMAIENQRMAAVTDLKNQVASLSIEIAEKLLRQELSDKDRQKALVDDLLKEINR
ncbi:F0F1 ATP synthase subunit B [bacterium]|nr:F0F1 ATP synthase subunit B [bacterium]